MEQSLRTPGATYRSEWPMELRPAVGEVDVRHLPNPGHGRSLPPRRSLDGTVNYCLSCPRVVSSRQRFCDVHRALRCSWLGASTTEARRPSTATGSEGAMQLALDDLRSAAAIAVLELRCQQDPPAWARELLVKIQGVLRAGVNC